MERRSGARVRCHLFCQLGLDEGRRTGAVIDLSRGGMRLLTDRPLDVGESVRVLFAPRNGKTLDVDTLVWHGQRLGDAKFAIGLVLSEPSPEYFEAVDALAEDSGASPEGQAAPTCDAPPEEPQTFTFCVRARMRNSPRTRTLYVDGASLEAARSRAGQALGADWTLLEVRRA
jgi:hypothetical protein